MLISSTLDSVGPSCRASARSLDLVKGEGAVPAGLVPNHVADEVCCSESDQGGDPWLCPNTFTDTREDELCSWFEARDRMPRGTQWAVILVDGMDRMGRMLSQAESS